MRAFLLTVAVLLASTGSIFSQRYFQNLQPDYYWDISINYGVSSITRPLGVPDAYAGNRTNIVRDYSIRMDYTFTPRWHMSLDIGDRKWETFANWKETGEYGQPLKSQNVDLLIASHAISESVLMNYTIPFYNKFHTINKANLYFGAMLGLVTTMNDGSIAYSKYKAPPDSNYTFVSRYDYAVGVGVSYGAQMGFCYYFAPRFGVNIELAARYARVGTSDPRYMGSTAKYYLLYFPETIGVHYRFP